jgi:hypothetical protein
MKSRSRGILAALLAFGLCHAAFGAGAAAPAGDTKKFESTPQVKAYRAQLTAMKAGDYEAYKKCMVKEAGPQMDKQAKEMGKSPKDILGFMAMMTPSDITITSVKVEGKKATLTATGKLDGEANKGTIEMAEEDGQWKVGHQSWSNAK